MRTLKTSPNVRNLFLFNLLLTLFLVSCNGGQGQESANSKEQGQTLESTPEKVQPKAEPFALDIEKSTMDNENYREVSWTGEYMQLVFMSLAPGEQIDLELHNNLDQFIRVEQGQAQVLMGEKKDELNVEKNLKNDWAVLIPAGYWHIVKNTGDTPLKLYVLYAPPSHPEGTVNKTYKEAQEYAEEHGH